MNKVCKVAQTSITTLALIFSIFSSIDCISAASSGQEAVRKISLPMSVKLDRHGHLSEAGAIELFRRAKHANQALGEPRSAKKMTQEAHFATWGTAQLFTVECADGSSYILKEIKEGAIKGKAIKEVERLERARTSCRLSPYIGPKVKGSLQINVPLTYVSYSHRGQEHVLAIMKKAQGISLQSLMAQFKENPHDINCQRSHAKAYYALGATLATFYKTFAHLSLFTETLVHGDLHTGNIFYHEGHTDQLITLIDNERIAKSLDKKRSISVDLGHLFVTSPFVMEWGQQGFLRNFDAKKWYSIAIPSFFLGFIRRFPKKERAGWLQTLKELLFQWDSKVKRHESSHLRGLIKEQVLLLEQQLVTEGKTALHVAARYSALSPILERMLFFEKTQAIRDRDTDGNIALHEAAYFGSHNNLSLLLKADRSLVGAKNHRGETPLSKAQYNRNSDPSRYDKVIRTLLKSGAH